MKTADRNHTSWAVMALVFHVYLAAVAEQFNDENGLKWPKKIAPFDIHLIAVNLKDESQKELAEELYNVLKSYRYDVLYDDRPERAGVKFADSDLIGLPIRITSRKKSF